MDLTARKGALECVFVKKNRSLSKFLSAGVTSGAVLFLPAVLGAQTAALGNVGGVVRDATGAVVSGATVVVSNSGTGAVRTLTTNGEGHYEARDLQPGSYEVIVSAGPNFGKVDRKNVPVTVGAHPSRWMRSCRRRTSRRRSR